MNNFLWFCASVGGFLVYAVVIFVSACIFLILANGDFNEEDFPMALCTIQAVAALFAIIFYMEQFFDK